MDQSQVIPASALRPMKIGDVARQSGVSVDAVRFYERRGLIAPEGRTSNGYRSYLGDTVERVRSLKLLQSLGLSLDEIAEVFGSVDRSGRSCQHLDGVLVGVVERLEAKIAELESLRDSAASQLEQCRAGTCDREASAAC